MAHEFIKQSGPLNGETTYKCRLCGCTKSVKINIPASGKPWEKRRYKYEGAIRSTTFAPECKRK